jgi:ribonuclease P/MRP protein subunit RPP40
LDEGHSFDTLYLDFAKAFDKVEDRDAFQAGIKGLEEWSREWQMLFNIGKCHILHVGRNNPRFKYTMDGKELVEVEQEKDVGVIIASNLKPSAQCAKAAKKANQVLGQLARAVTYRGKTFVRLFTTFVRPHLEYSVQSWSPWTQQDKLLLEKVQMRAIRMVSGLKGKTYEERLEELGLTSLEVRRERGDMIEAYKILTEKEDVNPGDWFTLAQENRRALGTRISKGFLNLVKPAAGRAERENFFSVRVVDKWNSLPDRVKEAETINTFKNRYDRHMSRISIGDDEDVLVD